MVQNEDLMRKRGGQPGNDNARKHGFYAQDGKRNWAEMDKMIVECREMLRSISLSQVNNQNQKQRHYNEQDS